MFGRICKHQIHNLAIAADAVGLSGGLDEGIVGLAAQFVDLGVFKSFETAVEHLQVVNGICTQRAVLPVPCIIIVGIEGI